MTTETETTNTAVGVIAYDYSNAAALALKAEEFLVNAQDYVIDSEGMLAIASADLIAIKGLQKVGEEERTSKVKPLNEVVKHLNNGYRPMSDFLTQAEAVLKKAILAYHTEQDRLAAIAQREADAAAQRERDRLQREQDEQAEVARRAAEASQAASEAAAAAAAIGDTVAEAAALEVAHVQAEASFVAEDNAQAAAITASVVSFTPSYVAPTRVTGISARVTYKAEVTDPMVLIKAVAEGRAPIQCLVADMQFLGAQARAFKKAGDLYPGVRAIAERGLSARAA